MSSNVEDQQPSTPTSSSSKVLVLFKQTGDAPILKQPKVWVNGHDQFAKIVKYLRTKLQREQVFVYLREAFTPSLEEQVDILYQAYGVDGRLVVNYACVPAWG